MELVSVSGKGYLLIWDLPGRYNEKAMPWPSCFHDAAHTRLNTEELKSLMPGKDVLPERLVYNYPNPTEGNFTTIRYRLEASAEVMIDIYDLGGEKVAEFEGPGAAQTENEVIWSLNDVGSGVYLCRVRAKSTEQEKAVIFKIAVVK